MENQEKTFDTICRVCLNHGKAEKMVSLIDNSDEIDSDENVLSVYGISFEKFTKINVKQNNYLPTNICYKCKKSLERFSTFVTTSEASDRKLEKLISFGLKQDLNNDNVKEVVRQYTLFNQNFPEDSKPSSSLVSTHNYDEAKHYSKKHLQGNEEKYRNIKVEIEVKQIAHGNDSDEDENTTNLKLFPQSSSDNVDIFLNSIEKLVAPTVKKVEKEIKTNTLCLKQKDTEKGFTCSICHRVLANRATHRNHVQRHGTCRFICDKCGQSYPVLAELTQHQMYRHGIGSTFQCDQCSFKSVRKLELIEHIRLHTGERPFTCEKCGSTFRRLAIYKTHLKSHGERTISCDHCPRKFYRRSEMLSHANNVHDRVYVFLCKVCNVAYAMAKTVRKHMLVVHGIPRNEQGKVVRVNRSSNPDSTFFRDRKGRNEGLSDFRTEPDKVTPVNTNLDNSFKEGNGDELSGVIQSDYQ